MYKLPRLFKIGLGLLLGSFILLFGFYNSYFSIQTNKQQIKSAKKDHPVNWLKPTGGTYPAIGQNDSIWIKVSKEKQRVYIMKGHETIYTMICSTGLDTSPDTSTPEGTFYIQKERGTSFYNGSEKEGAKYWVSWKNHGEFLFHSVATDKYGNVIQSEAKKLGHKASHGCVRLAVPDAKWVYDNIRYKTKVVIS
jgi:lipoprotein-anchoring transpeptidase ErfK/SrfK